jgi:hypothetical protein
VEQVSQDIKKPFMQTEEVQKVSLLQSFEPSPQQKVILFSLTQILQ